MAVLDIFSKRQKRLRDEVPEVYCYDKLPDELRVQIVQIFEEVTNLLYTETSGWADMRACTDVVKVLRREYGVFRLAASEFADERKDLFEFVLGEEQIERVLDGVEVFFQLSLIGARRHARARERVEEAVRELNTRFAERGVGYELSDYHVVRVDSQYVHSEVVKPALRLLNGRHYSGAQQEFLKAHAYFRNRDMKGVLTECLKSLESVMKSICLKQKWSFPEHATAGKLIDVCFDSGLVPQYWQSQFSGLRSILESGVPPVRNRLGAHGQGAVPTTVPTHVGAYVLHQTAAAIVFLVEAEAALAA